MATVTIRNLSPQTVRALKELAANHHRSMEQELRELIEGTVGDRLSVLRQVEASWARQARRPSAAESDRWIESGRP